MHNLQREEWGLVPFIVAMADQVHALCRVYLLSWSSILHRNTRHLITNHGVIPWQQLNGCSETRPFLSLQRVSTLRCPFLLHFGYSQHWANNSSKRGWHEVKTTSWFPGLLLTSKQLYAITWTTIAHSVNKSTPTNYH